MTWQVRKVEESFGGHGPMQCVSSTWCMDLDYSGATFLYDGVRWSRSPHSAPYGAEVLSCVSRSFCLAEDYVEDDLGASSGNGFLQRWDGTAWKLVSQLSVRRAVVLSCGAVTLCALTDARGGVYTFSAKNYRTKHFAESPSFSVETVSCSGPAFCLAVGHKTRDGGSVIGRAWTFNGSTWSAAGTFDSAQSYTSVSCGAPTSCAVVDKDGNLDTWNGTNWSSTTVPAHGTLPGGYQFGTGTVSCVGSSFCLAIDGAGGGHTFDGSTWSDSADPATGLTESRWLSCVRPTWCLVDDRGNTAVWDGAHWSTPKDHIPPSGSGLLAVSCPTESFCASVDMFHPVTFGPHGSHQWPEQPADPTTRRPAFYEVPVDISCAGKTSCMIVAGHRWAWFDGSSWTELADLGTADWVRVSCPTATFCAAINTRGQATTWNGTSWSARTTVMPHAGSGLSCPSAGYCLATDTGHAAVSYTQGHWNHYRTTPVGTPILRVSCVTARFCVGTVNTRTAHGGVVIRRDGHWSTIHQVGDRGLADLDCVTTTFCAGISGTVHASVFNGSVWTNSNTGLDSPRLDISCPTIHKCFAVGGLENEVSTGTR